MILDCFCLCCNSLELHLLRGLWCAVLFALGKCNYPIFIIFFIFSPRFLLIWIFWSLFVSHFFCCTSCASVSCRHAIACLCPFQDLTMKLSLIQSVGLIAKAISECVKKQGYVFSRKQELITVMLVSSQSFKTSYKCFIADTTTVFWSLVLLLCQPGQDFIKAESADSLKTPVRHLVMTTCANLMYPSAERKKQLDPHCTLKAKIYSQHFLSICTIRLLFVNPGWVFWRFCHFLVFYLWPLVLQASGPCTEWEWELWLAKGVCEQCVLSATWDTHPREN